MNASIRNGTYKATTYDHFYDLSLPEDGNVFLEITHNSGYSAIYDQDLNHVADLTAAGPLFLEAGSYVIHAD